MSHTHFSEDPRPVDHKLMRVVRAGMVPGRASSAGFEPGAVLYVRPEWRRSASLTSGFRVRVRAPARLHFNLLDIRRRLRARSAGGGGLGLTLSDVYAEVTVAHAPQRAMRGDVPQTALHMARLMEHLLGLSEGALWLGEAKPVWPAHSGLGANAALNTAVLLAINALAGDAFSLDELAEIGSANYVEAGAENSTEVFHGITTGVAFRAIAHGGLVCVDPNGALAGCLPLEDVYAVLAVGKPGSTIDSGLLDTLQPIDVEAYETLVRDQLLPAVADKCPQRVFEAATALIDSGTFSIATHGFAAGVLESYRQHSVERGALYAGLSTSSNTVFALVNGQRRAYELLASFPPDIASHFKLSVSRVGGAAVIDDHRDLEFRDLEVPVREAPARTGMPMTTLLQRLRDETHELMVPALLKGAIGEAILDLNDLRRIFLRAFADERVEGHVRFYLDGRPISALLLRDNPPRSDEDLRDWQARAFPGARMCIILNEAFRFLGDLGPRLALFADWARGFVDAICPEFEIIVFAGDYQQTPFGRHLDNDSCRGVLHLGLGPNPKRMALWDIPTYGLSHGGLLPNYDGAAHLAEAQLFDVGPGDVFFQPRGFFHVGLHEGFGSSVTVTIKELAPAATVELAIRSAADIAVHAARSQYLGSASDVDLSDLRVGGTAAEQLDDYKALKASNAGFATPPKIRPIPSDALQGRQLVRVQPFRMTTRPRGDRLLVFVRGRRLSFRNLPPVRKLVELCAAADRLNVLSILNRFCPPLSQDAAMHLLTLLVGHGGFAVEPRGDR